MCLHESLPNAAATEPNWDEVLEQIQVWVARRADGLSRDGIASRETDREIWSRAEIEVLGFTAAVAPTDSTPAGGHALVLECSAA